VKGSTSTSERIYINECGIAILPDRKECDDGVADILEVVVDRSDVAPERRVVVALGLEACMGEAWRVMRGTRGARHRREQRSLGTQLSNSVHYLDAAEHLDHTDADGNES
jgi:hypothetical protein